MFDARKEAHSEPWQFDKQHKGAHALQYTETETGDETQEELIRAGQNTQQQREENKAKHHKSAQVTEESLKIKQETTN